MLKNITTNTTHNLFIEHAHATQHNTTQTNKMNMIDISWDDKKRILSFHKCDYLLKQFGESEFPQFTKQRNATRYELALFSSGSHPMMFYRENNKCLLFDPQTELFFCTTWWFCSECNCRVTIDESHPTMFGSLLCDNCDLRQTTTFSSYDE